MSQVNINENKMYLYGVVLEIEDNISKNNENSYTNIKLEVDRLSSTTDVLPLTISNDLIKVTPIKVGDFIEVKGDVRVKYRTFNERSYRFVYGYVREYNILSDERVPERKTQNIIELTGYISKEPRYRKTSKTGRYITDLTVACNLKRNKSFYIPVICWGNVAKEAKNLKIGDEIKAIGRFQTRTYSKEENGHILEYSVQEISANSIEVINAENNISE